jgi:transcriptional regulator with XRE-family HTH domain
MTPMQCRMARAALEWSTTDLARAAAVGPATVNRFETGRDARISTVEKLRAALEAAGVLFIAENGGGVGVRLRKTTSGKHTEA